MNAPGHLEVRDINRYLYRRLRATARDVILSDDYSDPTDPFRCMFARDPDQIAMHEPRWHQWGVVTHTVQVGRAMRRLVPELLKRWFGPAVGRARLGMTQESIDGTSRWGVFLLSCLVHDYGKFTSRRYTGSLEDGVPTFKFHGHEAESGRLVRTMATGFRALGLTDDQIEYVARCAEVHYELGKVRDRAKKGSGYTLEYISSSDFRCAALDIATANHGFEREVGLIFLADSLGKTDVRLAQDVTTERELEAIAPLVEAEIRERFPDRPLLLKSALQLPVNVAAARRYLELAQATIRSPRSSPAPTCSARASIS